MEIRGIDQTPSEKSDLMKFLHEIKIGKGKPLRDQVYLVVRRAIVTGRLSPGSAVNEVEIAEALGISRTPVREAVKKVEDEGLIDVRAQVGTSVMPISRKKVQEAYIIRTALERESARRAALVITEYEVQRLRDLIDQHARAFKHARFEEALDHDDNFHRSIADANGFSMLWKVVDMTKAQMDRCRLLSLPNPGASETTTAQHIEIVDALEERDPDRAEEAMTRHLTVSLENTLNLLSRLEEEQGGQT